MNRKSIILSIQSTNLSNEEKDLIYKEKPWGIILFKRNIKSLNQLKKLTSQIRNTMKDSLYPILVDEEGGRVSRFSNLFDSRIFSQNFFGNLFEQNKILGKSAYESYLNTICAILKKTGININTVPVLDILKKKTHKIIGDRSYSKNIYTISSLAKICTHVLKQNRIRLS